MVWEFENKVLTDIRTVPSYTGPATYKTSARLFKQDKLHLETTVMDSQEAMTVCLVFLSAEHVT